MENPAVNNRLGGFWARFTAIWFDLFIVWIFVKVATEIFRYFGKYIPFELTLLISFLLYSSLLIGWKNQTIGKALCGLTVSSSKDKPVGYLRAFLREAICKSALASFVFLGFIWVAFSRKKRGWHDYIVGTKVVQKPQTGKSKRFALAVIFVLIIFLFAGKPLYNIGSVYSASKSVGLPSDITMPYTNRDPSQLVDISSLTEDDHAEFIKWLDENGKDPVDYAVETAGKHQITIFGEVHEKEDYLVFLNKIIPELYYRASVTCVALEVCLAEDNKKIDRLVTALEFDHELALEIARHQPWGIWGHKDYWDVLETVWRLNQKIPPGHEKMHLIGIDTKIDFPSIALVTGGEEAKIKSPIWEKLRAFRLFDDLLLIIKRDELMARNVEKEIIEKGRRGIVWVGFNHSFIHYQQPIFLKEKLVKTWNRMGMMLYQKYGEKIFQVGLHLNFFDSVMEDFIEPIMKERRNVPVGFDVSESPFGNLRDNRSSDYRHYPNLRFADKVCGYIYLKPFKKLSKSKWLEGYISEEMFVTNKPYYRAWAHLVGRKVDNSKDVNKALKFIFENP